eukprot:6097596-Karenia_brevis.AAC.1
MMPVMATGPAVLPWSPHPGELTPPPPPAAVPRSAVGRELSMALQPHPQNRAIARHTLLTKKHTDPNIITRTCPFLLISWPQLSFK